MRTGQTSHNIVVRLAALLGVLVLSAAACSTAEDGTTTGTTAGTTPTGTTTGTPDGTTSGTPDGTTTGTPDDAFKLAIIGSLAEATLGAPYGGTPPFDPATTKVHWFKSGGFYVVVFAGTSIPDAGPLCPGNSINTGTFEFVTNAPTSDPSACEGFSTSPPVNGFGPIVCGPLIIYGTDIPAETVGTLYGSLEVAQGGAIVGASSQVESSLVTELDGLDTAAGFVVQDDFVPGGPTDITC